MHVIIIACDIICDLASFVEARPTEFDFKANIPNQGNLF